jgi:hypothetical protein
MLEAWDYVAVLARAAKELAENKLISGECNWGQEHVKQPLNFSHQSC